MGSYFQHYLLKHSTLPKDEKIHLKKTPLSKHFKLYILLCVYRRNILYGAIDYLQRFLIGIVCTLEFCKRKKGNLRKLKLRFAQSLITLL